MIDKNRYSLAWAVGLLLSGETRLSIAQTADTPDVLRTSWGDPDLQGLWSSGTMTPFERPVEAGDKEFLTPEEAKAFLQDQVKTFEERPIREYDNVFMEEGPLVKTLRTSLIIDPPDGKLPPLTEAAKKQVAKSMERRKADIVDGPEDLSLSERCIRHLGTGPVMSPEPYNSQYFIVQTQGYVIIAAEQGHQYRIIPLGNLPRLPDSVKLWRGDPRGRWEGNTLVVESANVKAASLRGPQSDENLRVTERFTRTAADTIMYQATVNDPTVYVRPWTIEYNLYPSKGPFLEAACHEGNYGLVQTLSVHRAAEEAKQAAAAKR